MASIPSAAMIGCWESGAAIVTNPAPVLNAARPTRAAAPVFPTDPATTTRWPKAPLWASTSLGGKRGAMSAIYRRNTVIPSRVEESGTPMSMSFTNPARAAPGWRSRPRFNPAKVVVNVAWVVGPRRRP